MRKKKIELAIQVFDSLNVHKVRYALLRNFSEVENGVFNDLDIIIFNESLDSVTKILKNRFPTFLFYHKISFRQMKLVFIKRNIILEIDIFKEVTKFWFPIITNFSNTFQNLNLFGTPVTKINQVDELTLLIYKELLTYRVIRNKQLLIVLTIFNNLSHEQKNLFHKSIKIPTSLLNSVFNGQKLNVLMYLLLISKFQLIRPTDFMSWLLMNKILTL